MVKRPIVENFCKVVEIVEFDPHSTASKQLGTTWKWSSFVKISDELLLYVIYVCTRICVYKGLSISWFPTQLSKNTYFILVKRQAIFKMYRLINAQRVQIVKTDYKNGDSNVATTWSST